MSTPPIPRAIVAELQAEASRAIAKHGAQLDVPLGTGPTTAPLARFGLVLPTATEAAAVATRATDANFAAGLGTWTDIVLEEVFEALAEDDPGRLRAELIQAATMCARMIVALDAQGGVDDPAEPKSRGLLAAHLRVVYLLAESGGATHTQLERSWASKASRRPDEAWPFISDSGLRTRCSELVSWGVVEWSGAMGRTRGNRPSKIWQLTSEPQRLHVALGQAGPRVPSAETGIHDVAAALADEAGANVVVSASLGAAVDYLRAIAAPGVEL